MVPRVTEERKPERKRTERMARFWTVWGTEIRACLARKAFWTCEHKS